MHVSEGFSQGKPPQSFPFPSAQRQQAQEPHGEHRRVSRVNMPVSSVAARPRRMRAAKNSPGMMVLEWPSYIKRNSIMEATLMETFL